jgi:DNA polymerase-3 subunit gamma/tau
MKKHPQEQAYVVLARKYRPQGFEEVLGQPAVSVTLKNALTAKKIAHAYLFTGPRGVGKTTMARILAKALNCAKGAGPEPCGDCDSCKEIAASSSLDVLEMDAASHTGVDNVREVIIDTVSLAPNRDRYKVFIIDEAHMLSTPAFNALLKTLEEPPPHVVFILATTESAKIPATIASRCQRFRFRPIAVDLLVQHLGALAKKEGLSAETEALELLARSAEGSLRDAVSLLDQCHSVGDGKLTADQVRETFGFVPRDLLLSVATALLARDARGLASWLQKIYAEGVEPAQLVRDLRQGFEALYLSKLGLPGTVDPAWAKAGEASSGEGLAFLLRRLNKTLEELRQGDSPRLALELGLFGCLETAGDLAAWVERLESLERRLASGGAVSPAPVAAQAPPPEVPVEKSGGGTWADVIAGVRGERPSLATALEQARYDGAATLTFKRSFDRDAVARGAALIEAKMATILGRQVKLKLEVGETGQSGHIPIAAASVSEGPAPEGDWHDASEEPAQPSANPPAAVSKAQKILGGKLKIKKP